MDNLKPKPNLWTRLEQLLCVMMGADAKKAIELSRMVEIDHDRKVIARSEKQNNGNFSFKDLRFVVIFALIIAGLGLGGLALGLKDQPDLVVWSVIAALTAMILFFACTYLQSIMTADEGFQVIATWPVDSNTYLTSRLLQPMIMAIQLVLLLCGPACVVFLFTGEIPLVSGLLLFIICLTMSVGVVVLVSCCFSLMMRRFEPEQVVLLSILGMGLLFPFTLRLIELFSGISRVPFSELTYKHFPEWFPVTWISALAIPGNGEIPFHHYILGLVVILPLPILLYRQASQVYRSSLKRNRIQKAKAGGKIWLKLLTLGSKGKAETTLAYLCLSQARVDWRFRSQLYLLPLFAAALLLGPLMDISFDKLFSDPMNHDNLFNPAIIWIIVVAFPPVIGLPLLASSKDYMARWMMVVGPISKEQFASAQRHVMRLLFVVPFSGLILIGYLINGAPLLHVSAHIFMLVLIAEVMVCGMQNMFNDYPFSLPNDDEEFMTSLLPVFFVYEMISMIFGAVVFHVLYRWWWAYIAGVVVFLGIRHLLKQGKVFTMNSAEPNEILVKEESKPDSSTPLITAIKAEKVNLVKLLIENPGQLMIPDQDGKTALDWAEEGGNEQILKMVRARMGTTELP